MKKSIIVLLLVVFFVTSCASIVSKNTYPVSFDSTPSDVMITIMNKKGEQVFKGTTPTTVSLLAGKAYFNAQHYKITYSKPGYQEQTLELHATIDGWYAGNIIFGGLLGLLVVDPLTGNMFTLPASQKAVLVSDQQEED